MKTDPTYTSEPETPRKHPSPILLTVLVAVLTSTLTLGFILAFSDIFQVKFLEDEPVVQSTPAESVSIPPARETRIESIRDLNDALVRIAEAVKPSVVTVFTERVLRIRRSPFGNFFGDPFFEEFFRGFGFGPPSERPNGRGANPYEEHRQQGMGSGVIISAEGFIITNNHVVSQADEIKVRTLAGETYTASVIGGDPQTDIAVLQIKTPNLKAISIGNSDNLRVGEIVLAVGSPMSANLAHTVTQGIVSAKGRSNVGLAEYEDFIQTDASINPGNSGGALVNLDGELIGINTAIVSRSGGSQGIGFAVPINMARSVMSSLVEKGEVIRAWLGVNVQDLTEDLIRAMGLPKREGVLVAGIQKASPADKAGLQAGDIILEIDGAAVNSAVHLKNRVALSPPGTTVAFKIFREGKTQNISVKLERIPTEAEVGKPTAESKRAVESMGISVANITPPLAAEYSISPDIKGVVITELDPNSSAMAAGVRQGDVIQSINKTPVKDVQDFIRQSKELKKGSTVLLRIFRRSATLFVAFAL